MSSVYILACAEDHVATLLKIKVIFCINAGFREETLTLMEQFHSKMFFYNSLIRFLECSSHQEHIVLLRTVH